ncbi:MAG: C39 family peptidase [Candidatus Paraimprobicoccus trichonymphae]|uniref:C39 family peptidase n=1 Tax=Candidatus Paraimprobicoccus trichonymphae TaxID=3033793 RepID=A0AA48HZI3_9FIRM|nr:MAG: C39 family peptidase [Candidatus Paraimprobicoccus trichonymphae]
MKKISHIRQELNECSCGAVCVKMLLNCYNIEAKLANIFEDVSENIFKNFGYCKNNLILDYLLKLGLHSSVISVKEIDKVLKICEHNEIDVILNIKSSLKSYGGHYVLYLGKNLNNIYVNDPAKKLGCTPIKLEKLKKLMIPSLFSQISEKNTIIVVSKQSINLEEFEISCNRYKNVKIKIFKCLSSYIRK